MPGDLLDLILIVLAAAFAVAGYRQGFIVGVLSCIGFLTGAAVGAMFSPGVAKFLVHGTSQQALVAIILVFIAAMIGQLLASLLGVMARSRVTWRPVAMVDALGGAAVSVFSVLLIAWFIGSAVVNAPFPAVARQVQSSEVLRGVNDVMPPVALTMFSDFRHLIDKSPYTQVFGALGINGSANVPAPDRAVLAWPAVKADRNSVVKIWGEAKYTCDRSLEGSGFVISPEHVLTNAHVVAGMTDGPFVSFGGATAFRPRWCSSTGTTTWRSSTCLACTRRRCTSQGRPSKGSGASSSATRRTGRSARSRPGSARSGPLAARTSTGPARSPGRSTRCGRPWSRGTPAARCWPRTARSTGSIFAASTTARDTGFALTAGVVRPTPPRRQLHRAGLHPGLPAPRVAGQAVGQPVCGRAEPGEATGPAGEAAQAQ